MMATTTHHQSLLPFGLFMFLLAEQAGGELRIDVPLPPKPDAPAVAAVPTPQPAAENKPAEKPLSPLEKLRQERAKAKAAMK